MTRHDLAQLLAAGRLRAIEAERVSILQAFPGLRASTTPPARAPKRPSPTRTMSPLARRHVALGMKRMWARRRTAVALAHEARQRQKDARLVTTSSVPVAETATTSETS